jgi:nucleoside-diphosphate-sugar epimerase
VKILIVGGTGLISTAITRQLVAAGDQVTLYNRGRTPPRVPDRVTRIPGDRTDYPRFEAQVADAGPFDAVIDMVCYRPADAESAVRAFRGRTQRFLFCSTVDVYEKPPARYPVREDAPRGGLTQYGRDKARCEAIFEEAHARGDLPGAILRPAHTYGESGGILHSLGGRTTYVDRIRKGKPIVVHGDGESLWSSCHVEDVARAFVRAAANGAALGRAYNVTGEEWQSWNRYHHGVALALGAPPPALVHIPSDLLARVAPERAGGCAVNFQFSNVFDNGAARDHLGFRPEIGWVDGVRRTVAWLDAHRPVENSDFDPYDDRLIAAWHRLGDRMAEELAAPEAE